LTATALLSAALTGLRLRLTWLLLAGLLVALLALSALLSALVLVLTHVIPHVLLRLLRMGTIATNNLRSWKLVQCVFSLC